MKKTNASPRPIAAALRIAAVAAFLGVAPQLAAPSPVFAASTEASAGAGTAQQIADHFSSVKTMTGEFVQFGPHGEQTGGIFYIERPGKIRFNYQDPSPMRVIADGKSIVINNRKLDTWDLFPLSKTPLQILLSDRIEISGSKVKEVREDEDLTTIVFEDTSIFGDSKITMMFDPKSYDLRQWTITDPQGLDTTVMIFNTQEGVAVDPGLFKIDYKRVAKTNEVQGR